MKKHLKPAALTAAAALCLGVSLPMLVGNEEFRP